MNIAIGFGSTEEAFEAAEETAIRTFIEQRYSELALSYFTDEFADDVRAWIRQRGDDLLAQGKRYKDAEDYPGRYSYYWPHVVADASYIVVILSVHHINRRHAFSADGWAVLQRKLVWLFDEQDCHI